MVKDIKVKVRVEWPSKNKLRYLANKGTLTIGQTDKIYNRRHSRPRVLSSTNITPLSRFNKSITSQTFWSMVTITKSYSQRTQKLPFHWWMDTTITSSQVRCRAQVNIINTDKLKIWSSKVITTDSKALLHKRLLYMDITTSSQICIAKVWLIMAQTISSHSALILRSRAHQVAVDNAEVTSK